MNIVAVFGGRIEFSSRETGWRRRLGFNVLMGHKLVGSKWVASDPEIQITSDEEVKDRSGND